MHAQSGLLVSTFKRFWLWRENRLWVFIESFLATGFILLLCYLLNPGNPLYLKEYFPGPWLAPVIIVLQYGLGPGLLSALSITIIAFIYPYAPPITRVDLQNYVLGGFSLIMICAIFSASYIKRRIKAEELLVYTNDRLASLSSSYYMLRLSYDYLEQNVITKPFTLRMVMEELKNMGVSAKGHLTHDLCYHFLQVLTQYCSINCIGIYLYNKGKLSIEPNAEIGHMGTLDLKDPLVLQTITTQTISYTAINEMDEANACQYLVAIPMSLQDGTCLGYVIIKDMSFWTLNNETLTTLSVLVRYFVEEITCVQEMPEFFKTFPNCPSEFAKQLSTLLTLKNTLQIDSALCAIIVTPDLHPYNVIDNLQRQSRLPDSTWVIKMAHADILLTLIPFTNATGIHGFFKRMNDYIKTTLGLSPTDEQIKMRSIQLHQENPLKFLNEFMQFLGEQSFE